MNEVLDEAEQQKFGSRRGRDSVFLVLRDRAPSITKRKRVSNAVAMAYLNQLIYRRHALNHVNKKRSDRFFIVSIVSTFWMSCACAT